MVMKTVDLGGGWTNPFGKILVKMDHLPQTGMKIKNIWNHHPVIYLRVQSIKSSFKKQTIQDQPKKHNHEAK